MKLIRQTSIAPTAEEAEDLLNALTHVPGYVFGYVEKEEGSLPRLQAFFKDSYPEQGLQKGQYRVTGMLGGSLVQKIEAHLVYVREQVQTLHNKSTIGLPVGQWFYSSSENPESQEITSTPASALERSVVGVMMVSSTLLGLSGITMVEKGYNQEFLFKYEDDEGAVGSAF